MKKILLFALPMFMVVQLAAQQTEEAPNPRKKVTITRTWTDDQGQEKTITIIKEAEDTPENANWLESDDVAAPDDAATLERIEHDQRVDTDGPWKDLPGELRWHMEDLGREFQEVWPEIEYELRQGPGGFLFENGRPLAKQAFLGVVTEPTDGGAHYPGHPGVCCRGDRLPTGGCHYRGGWSPDGYTCPAGRQDRVLSPGG